MRYDSFPELNDTRLVDRSCIDDVLAREIRDRALRANHFPPDLFGEPAWDMLLDLAAGPYCERRISVSSLCVASGVPATTAMRYLARLEAHKLVRREADPVDKRRVFVFLTDAAIDHLQAWKRATESRPTLGECARGRLVLTKGQFR